MTSIPTSYCTPIPWQTSIARLLGLAIILMVTACATVDLGGPRVKSSNPEAGTLVLPDGASYAILPSQLNYSGKATYTYPDGRTLKGEFINGKLHGYGEEVTLQHRYTGRWREGEKNGEGTLERQDSTRYEGTFRNNQPHGKGEEHNPRGVYTGSFAEGRYHGEGQFKYGDHAYYRGQWIAGLRQGFGHYSHASGESYVGDWQQDAHHGFGNKKYPGGGTYEGAWRAGQRSGYGAYTSAAGVKYEGTWADDKRQGFGVQDSPDGSRYEGEWRADNRHGSGKLSRLDGSYHQGEWVEDYILGPGLRHNATGLTISGAWNQDFVPHGLLTFPDGTQYAGPLFKGNGKKVSPALVAWLQEENNQSSPHVQLFLASVYRDFEQPDPDLQLSNLWLNKAVRAGIAQAQFEMGVLQLRTDANRAIAFFTDAAAQGHPGANQRLGQFYHVGQHVSKDHSRAISHYRVAVEKGSMVATNNLAWLLATSTDSDVADPQQALELIEPLVMYLGNWQHIDTYAAALARLGDFKRAQRLQKLAVEQAQAESDSLTLEQMQQRLVLYQQETDYQE